MRITRETVILVASNLADEAGLNEVSLKNVAEKLNIKTPSLYNHISSLDELLHEIAHKGMKSMNTDMGKAAIGKSGDDAIKAIAAAYLHFVANHPGVYETIQWATWHETTETENIFLDYQSLLAAVISSSDFPSQKHPEIIRLLSGFLHGYITMNLRDALSNYSAAEQALLDAVDTVLLGLHQKYRNGE